MKSRCLDFAPGERFAYSNYGYCVLGRVIERASGSSYQAYVRNRVLIPAGAIHPRVADPFVSSRLPNEATYYDYPGAGLSESLDPKVRGRVPWPYNGSLSTIDAHGGWAASAIDLLRLVGRRRLGYAVAPPRSLPTVALRKPAPAPETDTLAIIARRHSAVTMWLSRPAAPPDADVPPVPGWERASGLSRGHPVLPPSRLSQAASRTCWKPCTVRPDSGSRCWWTSTTSRSWTCWRSATWRAPTATTCAACTG